MKELIYDWNGLNKSIFMALNQAINYMGVLPDLLYYISNIFFIGNFAIVYIITCIYCYLQIKNTNNKEYYFNKFYFRLIEAGTCYAIFGFIFAILKFSVNLPRPFCSVDITEFSTIADIETERCLSSFPSAHTGLIILLTYLLWPYLQKWGKIISVLLILVVAVARITLAMHYPADIIYSALGTIFSIILAKMLIKATQPLIILLRSLIFQLLFTKEKNKSD